jgi:N-acylneuraminate cytidylyltransferase
MSLIDRVVCSTDSLEIAAEAERMGVDVPFLRPSELAQDDSPEWLAWQHLADYLCERGASDSDLLVSLPTTSPLRAPADVENAIQLFRRGSFDVVLGVAESTRSPWFNMVTREESSVVSVALQTQGDLVFRRQDAPKTFDITTVVYVTTLGFVLDAESLFEGVVGSILIPRERSIDIDSELDLEIADFLMTKRGGGSHE